MASGMRTAKARTRRLCDARKSITPSRRFQPAWKLGIAAYSLTSVGGSTVRYPPARSVIVSTIPTPASRGGATGNSANTTSPSAPESRQTLRSR